MAKRWMRLSTALLIGSVFACSSAPLGPSAAAPNSPWPNEPPGMHVVTDWGFDETPPINDDQPIMGSPGWNAVYVGQDRLNTGWVEPVADASAPYSPPSVYDFVYPEGMVEGSAPGTLYLHVSTREIYVSFWWKPSSPFDAGPNGNKIAFLWNGGGGAGGQQFLILRPDGLLHVLPEYPGDFRWRTPNVNPRPVSLGMWHQIEWYADVTTGAMRWWLDRELQGSYADVTNPVDFDQFKFSPTWGGNSGARKRETDHYWFDHVHLSSR
jgi:hypothetical protein